MFLLRGVTGSQWQAALTHVGLRAESRQTTGAGWTSGTARDELTVTEVRGRAVLRRAAARLRRGGRRTAEVRRAGTEVRWRGSVADALWAAHGLLALGWGVQHFALACLVKSGSITPKYWTRKYTD